MHVGCFESTRCVKDFRKKYCHPFILQTLLLAQILLMGLKSLDSTVEIKPATEAQLDFAVFNSGMVLQILRSIQIIDGIYVFL